MTVATNTTTAPPSTLTGAQAAALLRTLLSTPSRTPAASGCMPTANSKPARQSPHRPERLTTARHQHRQQPQQQPQIITIDASTRIMGHCNTIHLPSTPSTQGLQIQSLVRDLLAPAPQASGQRDVNITVQAGVNVMGSRNAVILGGATCTGIVANSGGKEGTDAEGKGRKRGAEDDAGDAEMGRKEKRVRVE